MMMMAMPLMMIMTLAAPKAAQHSITYVSTTVSYIGTPLGHVQVTCCKAASQFLITQGNNHLPRTSTAAFATYLMGAIS